MTQYTYGGSPAAVLQDTAGNVVPDFEVLVYRAGTDELVTALYEVDGTTPISELRSNDNLSQTPGAIRSFKAADVTAIEYAYNGPGGRRSAGTRPRASWRRRPRAPPPAPCPRRTAAPSPAAPRSRAD